MAAHYRHPIADVRAAPTQRADDPKEGPVTTIQDRLRIVSEFRAEEHDHVRGIVFGKLERRLLHWKPEQVELELSVKERDTAQQHTVLECWISGVPRMVATSALLDLDQSIVEVRDDLWRQLDRYVTKQEASRKH
jgi:hypothetical protein